LSEHRRHTHPVTATDHRPQSGDSDVAGHPRPSPRDRVPPAIRPGPTRPHVHPDGRLPRLRPRPRPGKTRTLARPLHPLLRRRTPRTQTSPTRNLVHPRLPTTRQTNVATSSAFACTGPEPAPPRDRPVPHARCRGSPRTCRTSRRDGLRG